MGRLRRFGRVDGSDPARVAGLLPPELCSPDGYLESDGTATGYRRYLADLGEFLEGVLGVRPDQFYVAQVASAAGVDMSDWLRGVWGLNRH